MLAVVHCSINFFEFLIFADTHKLTHSKRHSTTQQSCVLLVILSLHYTKLRISNICPFLSLMALPCTTSRDLKLNYYGTTSTTATPVFLFSFDISFASMVLCMCVSTPEPRFWPQCLLILPLFLPPSLSSSFLFFLFPSPTLILLMVIYYCYFLFSLFLFFWVIMRRLIDGIGFNVVMWWELGIDWSWGKSFDFASRAFGFDFVFWTLGSEDIRGNASNEVVGGWVLVHTKMVFFLLMFCFCCSSSSRGYVQCVEWFNSVNGLENRWWWSMWRVMERGNLWRFSRCFHVWDSCHIADF